MTELFRRRAIKLLVGRELLNEDFARNLLSWKHSGFSLDAGPSSSRRLRPGIDNSVRILDQSSQESLAEYIARPPFSLRKTHYEPFTGRELFHKKYSQYFKQNLHTFDALDYLAELTQHIPPKGPQLIRRYGLYASRTTPASNRFQKAKKRSTSTRANAPGPAFSPTSTRLTAS